MKAWKISLILFILLSVPLKSFSADPKVRIGYYPDNIKVVLETRQEPDFQYYLKTNPPALIIELFNAGELKDVKFPAQPNEALLQGLSIKEKNPWVREININLGYWLPDENLKVYALKDPNRLVIELKRDYSFSYSWPLTPEVNWQTIEQNTNRGYIKYSILTIAPESQTRFDIALANDNLNSREKTSSMTSRLGALAGTNGGFFNGKGGPLGLVYQDKVLYPPVATRPPRTSLGITGDNKLLFDRIKTEGNKLIPLSGANWEQVKQALGGGPRLIADGKIQLTTDDEELGKNGNNITRPASRTAIGVKADGSVVWLTAMGYTQSKDDGVTLEELAQFMLEQNVVDAMAFDGGHSTTMVIQGEMVGKGRGDTLPEPKVADALVLKTFSPIIAPQRIELEKEPEDLTADGLDSTNITVSVKDALGKSLPDGTPVLFTSNLGDIPSQVKISNGKAVAKLTSCRKTGRATVTATCGIAQLPVAVYFLPDKPAKIFARITETKPGGNYLIQLQLTDRHYNPLPKTVLEIRAISGEGKPTSKILETDSKGRAEVEWQNGKTGDQFSVKTGKLDAAGKLEPGIMELKTASGG